MTFDAAMLHARLGEALQRTAVPGASLAVLFGSELHTVVGGVADVRTGEQVTPDTVFRLASVSKLFTATMVMQLVDQEVLHLDEPLRAHLPDLRLADENVARRLTARHLLTHTAGVDPQWFTDAGEDDDALARYVDSLAGAASVLPLGATASYGNTGMLIGGRLVETIDGVSWDEALRGRVLDELGLTSTSTLPHQLAGRHVAAGHCVSSAGVAPAPSTAVPRVLGPAGGITASARDLARFAQGYAELELVSGSTCTAIETTQVVVPGVPWAFCPDRWGLGWMLFDWAGGEVIGHDGGGLGFSSYLRVVPDRGFAVALLTNADESKDLFNAVVPPLFAELGIVVPSPLVPAAAPPPYDPQPFCGRYARGLSVLDLAAVDGALTCTATEPDLMGRTISTPTQVRIAPLDPSAGMFLCQDGSEGEWFPFTFSPLPDGTPCIHAAARATPLAISPRR